MFVGWRVREVIRRGCSIGLSIVWYVDLLAGGLVGWSVRRLVGWPVGWLVGCSVDFSIDSFVCGVCSSGS